MLQIKNLTQSLSSASFGGFIDGNDYPNKSGNGEVVWFGSCGGSVG